jgi:hypothetical protein
MNATTSKKTKKKETNGKSRTESEANQSKSGNQNKSWGQLLQQRRDELRDGGRSARSKREEGRARSIGECCRGRTGTFVGQNSSEVASENERGLEFQFTLKEVYDSIPLDVLKSLINNNFKQNEFVIIKKKRQQSKFVEDLYFRNKQKKKRKSPIRKKVIPPSEYMEKYTDYAVNIEYSESHEVKRVLAQYFIYYKKFYKEEDPEWNSKNMQKAVMLVNSLIEETGTTTMEVMDYVKKIMPLWYQRLINQESFPDRRPSLRLLFNGKRWYWSNRKLLYRQWS